MWPPLTFCDSMNHHKEGREIHSLPAYSRHNFLLISTAQQSLGEVNNWFNIFLMEIVPESARMGGRPHACADEDEAPCREE